MSGPTIGTVGGPAGHSHGTVAGRHRGRLATVFAITLTLVGVEVVGGIVAHSLVLLADAGHLATDAAGIGLSLLAVWFAGRPLTPHRTFGYQRAEILAAVVNAVLLFAVAGFVLLEAVRRLASPTPVEPGLMLGVGIVALLGNGVSLLLLSGGQRAALTIRSAFLEVASDALGAAAVIVTALVVLASGFERMDSIVSMLIAVFILPRTWRLLREAIDVLLEATPRGVDLVEVRRHLRGVPGVVDVHDLHAWTITSGLPVLSAHIVVDHERLAHGGGPVLDRLQDCLSGHFDVEHSTLQLEQTGHLDHEGHRHP